MIKKKRLSKQVSNLVAAFLLHPFARNVICFSSGLTTTKDTETRVVMLESRESRRILFRKTTYAKAREQTRD